jgi:hypothetical protein
VRYFEMAFANCIFNLFSGFESSAVNQDDFEMSNAFITAKVDGKTGLLKVRFAVALVRFLKEDFLLQTVTPKDSKEIDVDLSFVKYGARGHKPGLAKIDVFSSV